MGTILNSEKQNATGKFYGEYSFGNMYSNILSEDGINENKDIVEYDLKVAGILKNLDKLDVMDVGTGRQSLSLSMLGAKSVDHYDLSKAHVERFSQLLNDKYSHLNIKTHNLDLCESALPIEKYDFVYLSGIVHHFSKI